ncbi:kinesin-like protein KIN-14I isoform X3 [Magnolia sinica]|uniref:kinesin-like protein KIN-14I isoform X3 n=1 Tax=Magnolia sinica TaxID=86752 RepID=UPI002659C2E2|nr:kinesin-like protein KIN-14I isoform X3 [Magnolia sinica]
MGCSKPPVKVGPRQTIHAHEEIEALLTGRKLTTIVFFLDEMFKEITYNMELAGIIKLSAPSSFSLFESKQVVICTKSPDLGNGEFKVVTS